MLSDSGLWENILSYVKFMKELGYDKTNLAYEKYFDCRFLPGENLADRDERRKKDVREISDGFFFIDKKSGEEACFLSDWVSSFWSERGIKKMYFGRQNNEWVLGRIKRALEDKEKYSSCRYYNGNYDASFGYNPELKMAWYSEEFKGCGNGYYYFALNETHALFIEKD